MRSIKIDEVDDIDRDVLAIGTDFPPGHILATHQHRRAQFLYGATGSMHVQTGDGTWTIPPHRAVLIPAHTDHQVTMHGVSTRSLYIEPTAVPWFPRRCQVVDVSPLLRELLAEALDIAPHYREPSRDATLIALILHELSRVAPLPLEVPLPHHDGLRALCVAFLSAPDVHDPPARWARHLHVSERTLNRLFRQHTGMGYAQWRQRACVVHALPQLARGRPVGAIATDMGYDSPAAFSTMFQRLLGSPPTHYTPRAAG